MNIIQFGRNPGGGQSLFELIDALAAEPEEAESGAENLTEEEEYAGFLISLGQRTPHGRSLCVHKRVIMCHPDDLAAVRILALVGGNPWGYLAAPFLRIYPHPDVPRGYIRKRHDNNTVFFEERTLAPRGLKDDQSLEQWIAEIPADAKANPKHIDRWRNEYLEGKQP